MELHERQQFDFLFATAVERFVERIEQWSQGPALAVQRLRESGEAEGAWLANFVDAFFSEFLLDNVDGACFILRALAAERVPVPEGHDVAATLKLMSRRAFSQLLRRKAEELLEMHISYGIDQVGA